MVGWWTIFDKFDKILLQYVTQESFYIIPLNLEFHKLEVALLLDNIIMSEKATIIKPISF